jgi:hypothetical protein
MLIGFVRAPIVYWQLDWEYSLAINNNSSHPAFNVRVEPVADNRFSKLQPLPKINNVKPSDHVELEALYKMGIVEDNYIETDKILAKRIPDALDGLTINIIYFDEARNEYRTVVKIDGQDIINSRG